MVNLIVYFCLYSKVKFFLTKGLLVMKYILKKNLQFVIVLSLMFWFMPATLNAYNVVAGQGSSGEQVEQIQAMLSEVRLYYGEQDGVFGPQTVQAVKAFQKKVRKAQTGLVDKSLYKLLVFKSRLDFSRVQKTWIMEATAYSAYDPGCSGRTSTGRVLRKGIIAVDPMVIPLGTEVYIAGYGHAIADDQGGAVKGNVIDIAFDTHGEALRFGRKTVKVYIL